MGDLAVFHDPQRPEQGLAFAGRLAEEFKLGSGTWVCGGQLRAELLRRLAPLVDELVLCGEGHTNIGVLAWPNRAALEERGCRRLAERDSRTTRRAQRRESRREHERASRVVAAGTAQRGRARAVGQGHGESQRGAGAPRGGRRAALCGAGGADVIEMDKEILARCKIRDSTSSCTCERVSTRWKSRTR